MGRRDPGESQFDYLIFELSSSDSSVTAIRSELSGKVGCELCGVVKPLALFCRHLELLALCNLFSRQAIRMSDIVYTYSVVAFGLALSL